MRIEEQKTVERLLHQSEENMRQLADALPVLISYVDREHHYQFNNKAYEDWFNISREEIKGRHIKDVLGEQFYESIQPHLQKGFSGRHVNYQAEIAISSGAKQYVDVSYIPHTNSDGRVMGLYILATDITESKQYEKELEERLRFEEMISGLSAKFVRLPVDEIDGEITSGLRNIVSYLDIDRSNLFQFSHERDKLHLTHSHSVNGIQPVRRTMISDEHPWLADKLRRSEIVRVDTIDDLPDEAEAEKSYLKSQGIKTVVVTPFSAGGTVIGAISFAAMRHYRKWPESLLKRLVFIGDLFANALARKEYHKQLSKTQELLQKFMNHSPSVMFLKDRAGRNLVVNRAFAAAIGMKQEKMIGKTDHELFPKETADEYRRVDREVMELRRSIHFEEVAPHQDGIHSYVTVKFPLLDENNEPYAICGIATDITERKKKEAQLQKAYAEIKELKDQLEEENVFLRDQVDLQGTYDEIIGASDGLKYALYRVEQVATSDTTVLIHGETGTGKTLFARAILDKSARKDKPMITVNCAALPGNLIESELFGREKGAFTGAEARQIGRFELANGGTIFLDEVGELPLELQAKLLRVIQEREFERLGSPHTVKVDVRIIASTNRKLEEEVRKGNFREDLYYRLNVFPVTIPPLRHRKEDVPVLAAAFVSKFAKKLGKKVVSIPQGVMRSLTKYQWPGNVRELENVIERAMVTQNGPTLQLTEHLVAAVSDAQPLTEQKENLRDVEREHIIRTLEKTMWRISGTHGAAAILGMNPSTLRGRMRKLGIKQS